MISCISPSSSSADHTLNTLRYSDRLKDKPSGVKISSQPHSKVSCNNIANISEFEVN